MKAIMPTAKIRRAMTLDWGTPRHSTVRIPNSSSGSPMGYA